MRWRLVRGGAGNHFLSRPPGASLARLSWPARCEGEPVTTGTQPHRAGRGSRHGDPG